MSKFEGDDYHVDYPNPPKKYEPTNIHKLEDRISQLEWALKVSIEAMQKNIAYYSIKDERAIIHALEIALPVFRKK